MDAIQSRVEPARGALGAPARGQSAELNAAAGADASAVGLAAGGAPPPGGLPFGGPPDGGVANAGAETATPVETGALTAAHQAADPAEDHEAWHLSQTEVSKAMLASYHQTMFSGEEGDAGFRKVLADAAKKVMALRPRFHKRSPNQFEEAARLEAFLAADVRRYIDGVDAQVKP